jgi:6,7-dimethyl-8-ribityllumazine synthase
MSSEKLNGKGLKIGVVVSRFNAPIVEKMRVACERALLAHGVEANDIVSESVAGALEIPLALQCMAMTRSYDALIAIGAVIRGETYHFEVVSNESCRGVMNVMLENALPIANGILTTENDEQALARVEEKGADCAVVAIELAQIVSRIRKPNKARPAYE